MKILPVSLLLIIALNAAALESGRITDIARPQSVFNEQLGKDPFSPNRKPAVDQPIVQVPAYRLTLNAITQENGQSGALISGAVLKEGEVSFLKSGDSSIKIICREIRKTSVLLQVASNTAPIELNFGQALKLDGKGMPLVPGK